MRGSSRIARRDLLDEKLTYCVIGGFFEVYRNLRYGLLEHLYVAALERELRARGHRVGREVWVPVMYKGEEIGVQRLDMLVDDRVVVEVKSTRELHRSAARQLHCYLSATKLETGLLLHFGLEPRFFRLVCSNSGAPQRCVRS